MPFEKKKKNVVDPEWEAEQELDRESGKKNLSLSDAVKVTVKDEEMGEEDRFDDAISPGRQLKSAFTFKEAKAERKKRCRGVSGSSIKKDGGRFELGFENRDDYDDGDVSEGENYEEYVAENYAAHVVFDSESDDISETEVPVEKSLLSTTVVRLQTCLISAIKDSNSEEALHSMRDVLLESFDEKTRLETIAKALDDMIIRDVWTPPPSKKVGEGEEVDRELDRMAEYKTVCLLAKLIDEGLIHLQAFEDHFTLYPVDSQTHRLMRAAVVFYERKAPELRGELMSEPPKEFADVVEDACRSGEVSSVKDALVDSPYFHADVIRQVCIKSTGTMDMNVIYNASKTCKDLITEKVMTMAAVNAGVSRFIDNLNDTEVDLPGASSLSYLLISYCYENPVCLEKSTFLKCPLPKKFLRQRTRSSGRLSILVDDLEECNENNYIKME